MISKEALDHDKVFHSFDGKPAIIAAVTKISNDTLMLRDDAGIPI